MRLSRGYDVKEYERGSKGVGGGVGGGEDVRGGDVM